MCSSDLSLEKDVVDTLLTSSSDSGDVARKFARPLLHAARFCDHDDAIAVLSAAVSIVLDTGKLGSREAFHAAVKEAADLPECVHHKAWRLIRDVFAPPAPAIDSTDSDGSEQGSDSYTDLSSAEEEEVKTLRADAPAFVPQIPPQCILPMGTGVPILGLRGLFWADAL